MGKETGNIRGTANSAIKDVCGVVFVECCEVVLIVDHNSATFS